MENTPKRVALLGASITNQWKIPDLPKRMGNPTYRFEFVGVYDFDKSQPLENLLARERDRPDIIIIKECAAYFPRNLEQSQQLIARWVAMCKAHNVIPILATVVPIARPQFPSAYFWKDMLRKYILHKTSAEDRLRNITEYNDWIISFARQNGLAVLDMETPLRVSDTSRWLRESFHSGDYLHINADAYRILDQIVLPALAKAK